MSYIMQDKDTAFDLASAEGHSEVCQELLTRQSLWTYSAIAVLCEYYS